MQQISEDALEEVAVGQLSRYRSERLQAHLLSCRLCQEQFAIECEIRGAVKEAGRKWRVAKVLAFGRAATLILLTGDSAGGCGIWCTLSRQDGE